MNSINPYDLLNVTSESTINELKKNYYQLSLYCHPDKGGSKDDMIIIQNAYEYIKLQLENSTEQTYEQLEQEFQDFCKIQEKEPPKFCKIFSETHEEWSNAFNTSFTNNKYSNLFDKGYGEFMDQSENSNLEQYKPDVPERNKHNFTSDLVIYKEPNPTPIDVDTNMPLDKKEIKDFTYQGMSDYKIAFSESENLEIKIKERTLDDIINERNSNTKVLIIYKNSKYSGNYQTALRISKYFNNSKLHHCDDNISQLELNEFNHVIAIHLNKCYNFLKKINISYTIIFSGTDCDYYQLIQPDIYKDIINKATNIVTFNLDMKDRINYIYNPMKKITIIPQAVDIQYDKIEIKEQDYYVWVGKLRKIKNPELLFKIAESNTDINYIMIGDTDSDYKDYEFPSNIKYLGAQDRNTVINYICNSNGLINTSLEEGMSDAVLSAMALGIPVLVKNNSGNRSIVTDKTGYLFNNRDDFNKIKLIPKKSLNAKIYIHNNHNLSNEHIEYQKIII